MTITSLAQANAQGVTAAASGKEAVVYVNGITDPSVVDPTLQAKGCTAANKALLYFAQAQGLPDGYFGYVLPGTDGDPCK